MVDYGTIVACFGIMLFGVAIVLTSIYENDWRMRLVVAVFGFAMGYGVGSI